MLRGAFIAQRFFYKRWLNFLFGAGLVAVNFMVTIAVCYSWIGSFDIRSLNSCKCVSPVGKKIHECHFLNFESSTRRASTPEKFQKSKNAYFLNGGNIR